VSEHEVDVVLIGMGPGGEYAAQQLAQAGLVVAGVEDSLVGGECPYWGCVPSKMMIRAADLLTEGRRIPGLAGASTVQPDWAAVAGRIRTDATDDWHDTAAGSPAWAACCSAGTAGSSRRARSPSATTCCAPSAGS